MKVQLQRQAVRLRVDEEELAQLLAGESVENLTRFGGDRGWGMVLSLHAGQQAVLLEERVLPVDASSRSGSVLGITFALS